VTPIFLEEPLLSSNYRNYIINIRQKGDTLFVGSANGIYLINKKTDSLISKYLTNGIDISHRESSNSVQSIYPSIEKEALWAILNSGAYRINYKDGKINKYTMKKMPNPYAHHFNTGIFYNDTLLMPAHGLGLVAFSLKSKEFIAYETQTELGKGWEYNIIRSAIPLNDSLILVNAARIGNGIFNINSKKYNWLPTPPAMKDGVFIDIDKMGFAWSSKRGKIFKSTKPVVKSSGKVTPIIDITKFEINGIVKGIPAIDGDTKYLLQDKDHNIELEFSLTQPHTQDSISYEYSYGNKEWNPIITPNHLKLFNLKSGDYTVSIRAKNKAQQVLAEKAIAFNIYLPFYKSIYFFMGLFVLFLLGTFIFLNYKSSLKTTAKLRELDKAKSTFFANISHEFRTPLTLIKGPIDDQLENKELSIRNRKVLGTAKTSALRLESLVDQLLALSKLESGNLKLEIQCGSISNFLKAQTQVFSFVSQEKNILFSQEIDSCDTAWFDSNALEKIIINLLGNAFKYTPEGHKISFKGLSQNNNYTIEVCNTGSYLSSEEIQHIFTRFYQTNPRNPGTGIGLALTKELVELHKGTITVHSTKEETTFKITLAINKSNYSNTEILSEKIQEFHPEEIDSILEKNTEVPISEMEDVPILLIIDDNKDIREYIVSIFENKYAVYQAQNACEGFEKALSIVPDIIITDLMMPGEDGFNLTSKLKSHELTYHIPITILSGKTEDVDKLKGMETGADAYITKPFSTKLLKATLENLLNNRRKLQDRFSQEFILTPKEIAITSADEKFLERLQKVLDEKLTHPDFSSSQFFEEMGVSRMQLHRKLKALTGQSTSEFLRSQRLKAAVQLIKQEKISISEVGYAVGFNDPSYFTKCFKQEYGVSPTEYLKK
jgi:signal transduction histidine kinase/DNA-binding response OmpR family regulator